MIALDTNFLVQAHQREASHHEKAKEVLRMVAESPAPWAVCLHGFVEFYGIVTHTKIWSTPSTPEEALDQIQAWRESSSLRILCDTSGAVDRLGELAVKAKVRGALIHDARIAACCLVSGIRELWTVDRDFSRFPALKTKNPLMD